MGQKKHSSPDNLLAGFLFILFQLCAQPHYDYQDTGIIPYKSDYGFYFLGSTKPLVTNLKLALDYSQSIPMHCIAPCIGKTEYWRNNNLFFPFFDLVESFIYPQGSPHL